MERGEQRARPTFEECMRDFYEEVVRAWLDEHPPSAEVSDDSEGGLGFDHWMRLLDVEYSKLVTSGRMPPHESGLYTLEAHRLGIYPTYDIETAADVVGAPVENLQAAIRDGDLDAVPVYGVVFIGISALCEYASARGLRVYLPDGGDWLAVTDAERQQLRELHERQILRTVRPRDRAMAVERLELDAARAAAYLAAQSAPG